MKWQVPCCQIEDQPRFPWRGLLLDEGRHFFGKEFVKHYIDLLAAYKMNTLHWHLTEDQGWRIEIKKYPKLTEIGSWRDQTEGDGNRYGGFYTQDEIREIVAYAAQRHVTIVPEIEMPGHSLAALAAYPQFSCTGGPFKVRTVWGIEENVYCAGNDATFAFLDDVLDEVIGLFPSTFIHSAATNVPRTAGSMPQVPGPHQGRGPEERTRVAELLHSPDRRTRGLQGPAIDRLGRDSRRRPAAQGHGDELARHGRRHRGGPVGSRLCRHAHLALLSRLSLTRSAWKRPIPSSRSRKSWPRASRALSGRAGQHVDRAHAHAGRRRPPGLAAAVCPGGGRLVAQGISQWPRFSRPHGIAAARLNELGVKVDRRFRQELTASNSHFTFTDRERKWNISQTSAVSNGDSSKVWSVRFLLFIAGLGGLLYGIDVGIIAGALPYLQATSGLDRESTLAHCGRGAPGQRHFDAFRRYVVRSPGPQAVMAFSGCCSLPASP